MLKLRVNNHFNLLLMFKRNCYNTSNSSSYKPNSITVVNCCKFSLIESHPKINVERLRKIIMKLGTRSKVKVCTPGYNSNLTKAVQVPRSVESGLRFIVVFLRTFIKCWQNMVYLKIALYSFLKNSFFVSFIIILQFEVTEVSLKNELIQYQ
jgi:hypothetical protein